MIHERLRRLAHIRERFRREQIPPLRFEHQVKIVVVLHVTVALRVVLPPRSAVGRPRQQLSSRVRFAQVRVVRRAVVERALAVQAVRHLAIRDRRAARFPAFGLHLERPRHQTDGGNYRGEQERRDAGHARTPRDGAHDESRVVIARGRVRVGGGHRRRVRERVRGKRKRRVRCYS